MTKVKTILKEFCSAKDILAINRLGLLNKGEERESQPVPWRHRLQRAERRELVHAEMRMNIRRAGRVNSKDKAKAVTEAREPQNSRMGERLIQLNTKAWGSKGDETTKLISGEHRRTQLQLDHQKQNFLRQSHCLNREPLIVVERPPSPKVRSRAKIMEDYSIDPDQIDVPNYMRPLKSRSRAPSTLTTIDVFTVETRKKKNLWEEATEVKEGLNFKAKARPSARLSNFELRQLKFGHELHKPTTESIAKPKTPPKAKIRTRSLPRPKSTPGSLERSASPIFITETPQLPQAAGNDRSELRSGLAKSVSFFDGGSESELSKEQSCPRSGSSTRHRQKPPTQSASREFKRVDVRRSASDATGSMAKQGKLSKLSQVTKDFGRMPGVRSAGNGNRKIAGEVSREVKKETNSKFLSREHTKSGSSSSSSRSKTVTFEPLPGTSDNEKCTCQVKEKNFLAVLLDE